MVRIWGTMVVQWTDIDTVDLMLDILGMVNESKQARSLDQ